MILKLDQKTQMHFGNLGAVRVLSTTREKGTLPVVVWPGARSKGERESVIGVVMLTTLRKEENGL